MIDCVYQIGTPGQAVISCTCPLMHRTPRVPRDFCTSCRHRTSTRAVIHAEIKPDYFSQTASLYTKTKTTVVPRPCGNCPGTESRRPHKPQFGEIIEGANPRWAVVITHAPRLMATVEQTVASLRENGWDDITIFAEPGCSQIEGVNWIQRPDTIAAPVFSPERIGPDGLFGAYQNFVQSMADILIAKPDADSILYVQDDVLFAPGTRAFLERDLWPSKRSGIVSPYCPNQAEYRAETPFLRRIIQPYLIGALCYAMPADAIREMLALPLVQTWKGGVRVSFDAGWKKKALDAFAGKAMEKLKRKVHYYTHSMVRHFEPEPVQHRNSSIAGGKVKGLRKEWSYVENIDVSERFRTGWVRYNLNGSQRFGPMPEISTDPIHVIIPMFGLPGLTGRCIHHVARSTTRVNICVINNGSRPEEIEQVVKILDGCHREFTVINNPENLGFTTAVNQGLELSAGRHVLVLNNDCRVSTTCLENMRVHLEWHGKVAAICPLTNDHGECSIRRPEHSENVSFPEISVDPDVMQKALNGPMVVSTMHRLPWFCCLLHRDAVAEIPRLPEDDAVKSGLGVDDWWCRRAVKKGWKLLIAYDAFAQHDHMTTFKHHGIDRKSLQAEARRWLSGSATRRKP